MNAMTLFALRMILAGGRIFLASCRMALIMESKALVTGRMALFTGEWLCLLKNGFVYLGMALFLCRIEGIFLLKVWLQLLVEYHVFNENKFILLLLVYIMIIN